MATHSQSLIEIQLQNRSDNDDTTGKKEPISNEPISPLFTWLGNWIFCFPTVTRHKFKNGQIENRNSITIKIYIALVTAFIIGAYLWYIIDLFIVLGVALFPFVYMIAMGLQTSSKLISMYYFWKHFDMASLQNISLVDNIVSIDHKAIINKVNRRMKIMLVIIILCQLTLIIIRIVETTKEETDYVDWIEVVVTLGFYITTDIPVLLSQFILSILYCKGHVFIANLTAKIQNEDTNDQVDFETMIDEYKAFRTNFKKSIDVLELMLKCRLSGLVVWVWINISRIMEPDSALAEIVSIVYLIYNCLPFIELVLSGSPATDGYYLFKKQIYEFKALSMDLLNFKDYMNEYPFLVKIFAKEISIKNALKLSAAFIGARMLTYLFKNKII
eukprot:89573_1